jgi:hypothetical protein
MMKKYLLSLLITVGMLLITCGEEPPEEFYEGTPEDSAAIYALLEDYPKLLETINGFIETYTAVEDMEDIIWAVNDSFFKGDSIILQQLVDSSALLLTDSSRFTDLWFTKDTSCTVYLRDTFMVTAQFHYSELQSGYFFYPPGDTTTVLDTVMVNQTPGDTSKPITGEGERLIFFEPIRDPEIDSLGDTVWVIRDPMEWVLKRISYGNYYYPNRGAELPGITNVVLQVGDEVPDTIYASSSVDTFPGHAMNRLRSIDSLLTYAAGDTLEIDVAIGAPLDGDSVAVFASCNGDARVELADGSGEIVLSGSGIVNLYIEMIRIEAYFYITPDKGYVARVWLIPINLGGTQ